MMRDGATAESDTPSVVLADDHDLFRTGLRNLLEDQGVRVIAEAATGREAVRHVRELSPQVVLMDLNMPDMGGVEATREIARISPLTNVVVLTISDRDGDILEAILAGACGYLLKDSSITDLLRAITAAVSGEALVSPQVVPKLLRELRVARPEPGARERLRADLTARELDVLRLIANGKDNAQIAAELHVSPKTVKNHISNILMKLHIENRIQAAVYAVKSGLV